MSELTEEQRTILELKQAYEETFSTTSGQKVLADMATFARSRPVDCNDANLKIDPLKLAVQSGRREVVDRIDLFRRTRCETLFLIYNAQDNNHE